MTASTARPPTGTRRSVRPWAETEVALLRQLLTRSRTSYAVAGKKLGRPQTSIRRKAAELGISNRKRSAGARSAASDVTTDADVPGEESGVVMAASAAFPLPMRAAPRGEAPVLFTGFAGSRTGAAEPDPDYALSRELGAVP